MSTNVLVSDLFGESRAACLNVLGTFFGVGALCIPLASAALAASLSGTQLLVAAPTLASLASLACLVRCGRFPAGAARWGR